jgi:hypothetical protein
MTIVDRGPIWRADLASLRMWGDISHTHPGRKQHPVATHVKATPPRSRALRSAD